MEETDCPRCKGIGGTYDVTDLCSSHYPINFNVFDIMPRTEPTHDPSWMRRMIAWNDQKKELR